MHAATAAGVTPLINGGRKTRLLAKFDEHGLEHAGFVTHVVDLGVHLQVQGCSCEQGKGEL